MLKIKSESELQQMTKEHYEKGENFDIILKTSAAAEFLLTLGMDSNRITLKMRDLGVRTTELGLSMALALKNTDDKDLSEQDRQIKKITVENYSEMLKELEGLLQ